MTVLEYGGIVFTEEEASGFHLSRLIGWDDGAPTRYDAPDRPQGHGTFRPGPVFRGARVVSVEGTWSGASIEDAYRARRQLAGVDPDESPFRVTDPLGTLEVLGALGKAPRIDDQIYSPFFTFDFDIVAADSFRYGTWVPASTGVPSASSGLVWPLGSAGATDHAWTGAVNASPSVETVNGVEVRRNLVRNPNAVDSLDFWVQRLNSSLTRDVSPTTGRRVARAVGLAASGDLSSILFQGGQGDNSRRAAAVPGDNMPSSILMEAAANNTVAMSSRIVYDFYGSSGYAGSSYGAFTDVAPGQSVRLEVKQAIVPQAGTSVEIYVEWAGASGSVAFFREGMLDADGTYFDGSSGLIAGKYFDWGTDGVTGRVTAGNSGTADTYSTFEITGGLSEGFLLTWVPTGAEIRFTRPVLDGSVITIDPRTGRAKVDGQSDVTGFLVKSEWWPIRRGEVGEVQFTPLGVTSGTPSMTVRTADAFA